MPAKSCALRVWLWPDGAVLMYDLNSSAPQGTTRSIVGHQRWPRQSYKHVAPWPATHRHRNGCIEAARPACLHILQMQKRYGPAYPTLSEEAKAAGQPPAPSNAAASADSGRLTATSRSSVVHGLIAELAEKSRQLLDRAPQDGQVP